jgi:twitching motility protein PilT
LIREAKNHQIYSAMQTGGKFGMQTMDAALVDLVRRGLVSQQEAEKRSSNPDELRRLAGGTSVGASAGGYATIGR